MASTSRNVTLMATPGLATPGDETISQSRRGQRSTDTIVSKNPVCNMIQGATGNPTPFQSASIRRNVSRN